MAEVHGLRAVGSWDNVGWAGVDDESEAAGAGIETGSGTGTGAGAMAFGAGAPGNAPSE